MAGSDTAVLGGTSSTSCEVHTFGGTQQCAYIKQKEVAAMAGSDTPMLGGTSSTSCEVHTQCHRSSSCVVCTCASSISCDVHIHADKNY
eukprot:1161791-Pelagomonas_calceolata.AAC.2